LRALIEQSWLPARARADRVELLHSLGTTGPVLGRVPSVVTVLDLIYHHVPGTFPKPARLGLELIVPRAARHARRVIAISEFGAEDIAANLDTPRTKIDVVHLGPGSPPGHDFTAEAALRDKLGIRPASEVVLCVSAALAHKNLPRLIDAFASVVTRHDRDAVLVLVGHGGGTGAEMLRAHAAQAGIGDRVILTGWIEQAELEGLYRCATVFAYPSLLEGFGLPILEAMNRGVPVACARASSLPEVGGDAAEYFDPTDTDAISAAIASLLCDEDRRQKLVARGRERVARFSWERCARETLAVYRQALGGKLS
jgi:glycosyltransferase involved in cell wall biosynthesis